ncbi:hypothetical protein ACXR2T_13950 [Leucobacter sp. HY1910]
MDLKFSFGGASPDHHDHGDAPSKFSFPLTPASGAGSASDLEVVVTQAEAGVRGEVRTGAGVVYTSADVACADDAALPRAARSAAARAVAALEGPLAEQVSAVVLELGSHSPAVLKALGVDAAAPAVTDELRSRIGVAAGVPIRIVA